MASLPQITIHNSLSGQKEPLSPITPGQVKMYVCGLTVYDDSHIGHGRMAMVYDMVVRYLRAIGYEVTFVRNVTDIDDKIIRRAAENGESIESLTARTIDDMHRDFDALGLLRPDIEPYATQAIPEMLEIIQILIDKNLAYQANNGDVLFRVGEFPGYGKLSKKDIADLRAGERIAIDQDKDDPLDFVLWKAAKPGEPAWASPYGEGRPGWHIECSAMTYKHLGKHFDIHGGGMDLKFPHHENEIAQSEGAHGCTYANLWMHNGFINVDNEKMSKSLGNFFTIREILAMYHPEVIRGFILGTHYRRPINFSDQALHAAKKTVDKFYQVLSGTQPEQGKALADYVQRFDDAMLDDFNAPGAIAVLHEISAVLKKAKLQVGDQGVCGSHAEINDLAATLLKLTNRLGWLQTDIDVYLQDARTKGISGADDLSDEVIQAKVEARDQARKDKDFAESDRLRDWLKEQGVVVEDDPAGSRWHRQ